MDYRLKLNAAKLASLRSYLDRLPDEESLELSDYWDAHRKRSVLKVDDEAVMFRKGLNHHNTAPRFDDDYLSAHGLVKADRFEVKYTRARKSLRAFVDSFSKPPRAQELRAFGSIWNRVDAPISAVELAEEQQSLSLAKIKSCNFLNELLPMIQHLGLGGEGSTYLEIGAGSCYLVGLLKERLPGCRFYIVDLPSTIPFGFVHLSTLFPDAKIALPHDVEASGGLGALEQEVVFLTPDQAGLIPSSSVSIGCNTDSFMEMMPEVVAGYFSLLRRVLQKDNLFYCSNRAEKRMHPAEGEARTVKFGNPNVIEEAVPVRFHEYPWGAEDEDFFLYESEFHRLAGFTHTFFVKATRLATDASE